MSNVSVINESTIDKNGFHKYNLPVIIILLRSMINVKLSSNFAYIVSALIE